MTEKCWFGASTTLQIMNKIFVQNWKVRLCSKVLSCCMSFGDVTDYHEVVTERICITMSPCALHHSTNKSSTHTPNSPEAFRKIF